MTRLMFSIRGLLLVTASIAGVVALTLWLTKDYRERRQAEMRIRSYGAAYAHVDANRSTAAVFGQPITSNELSKLKSIDRVELQGTVPDKWLTSSSMSCRTLVEPI